MANDKKSRPPEDDAPGYPRHTPGQAEGSVEDVEGGSQPKDTLNPEKPSQAEGAPEDVED
ncbi:hypothetical protein BH24DEI2_BH24DEI2_16390 [soil metagenome]